MKSADTEEEKRKIATAKINTELGMAYLQRKEVQRAKQRFLLALDEAPSIPEPWYGMAYFFESTGDTALANQYYLKAIAIAGNTGDVLNNYGTFLCRSGKYQQSISYFLRATEDLHYLYTAGAYENAGLCALKIPDAAQARIYFRKALDQDPRRIVAANELFKLSR